VPHRTLAPPTLLLVLGFASLACGADQRPPAADTPARAGVATPQDSAHGAATGVRDAAPAALLRPTPIQGSGESAAALLRCQNEMNQEFGAADSATSAGAPPSAGAAAAGPRAAATGAGTVQDSAGRAAAAGAAPRKAGAPPAVPARKYKTGDDPAFAARMGWPPSSPPPLAGAILPCRRIVAYYGNPFSKKMGVLGEYPYGEMVRRFHAALAEWNAADPHHPVVPAFQLIAVVAQGSAGSDGRYRLRMPDTLVQKVYGWAKQEHGLLFLDVQVGRSTLQAELPRLEPFLKNPDVHLAIDPEFSMKDGTPPGRKIGTFDAADINYASRFLAGIVEKYQLPPKVLVVHRFTRRMVTNARQIKLRPEVQIVMNMDGWGAEWLKRDSYKDYIVREPVEYTGFKIFYHNDIRKAGWTLMKPGQVLGFRPYPLYIQYQ
jgi:hypothetical protein